MKPIVVIALLALMVVPGATAITFVQERSAGGTDGTIDGTPTLSATIDATSPSTVNATLSKSHVHLDTTAQLIPTTVSGAQATWQLRWATNNTQLCSDSVTALSGTANRREVSWSVDCYLPAYVTGDQTFFLNYSMLTNARASASFRLVQNEVLQVDNISIETALDPWVMYLLLAGLASTGIIQRNPLLVFTVILATLAAAVGNPFSPAALAVYVTAAVLVWVAREALIQRRKRGDVES